MNTAQRFMAGWISIYERLPQHGQLVAVMTRDGMEQEAAFYASPIPRWVETSHVCQLAFYAYWRPRSEAMPP